MTRKFFWRTESCAAEEVTRRVGNRLLRGALALAGVVLCGCQTAKITDASVPSLGSAVSRTDTILVKSFDASKAAFKGEHSGVNALNDSDRQRISRIISQAMLERLMKEGYTAKAYSAGAPPDAVVVDGTVTEVDKGSYSKRLWIGMGAGAASITAQVRIHRASTPAAPLAELKLAGQGGFAGSTGGIWANEDWIGIYSASLGYKVAQYIAGKAAK